MFGKVSATTNIRKNKSQIARHTTNEQKKRYLSFSQTFSAYTQGVAEVVLLIAVLAAVVVVTLMEAVGEIDVVAVKSVEVTLVVEVTLPVEVTSVVVAAARNLSCMCTPLFPRGMLHTCTAPICICLIYTHLQQSFKKAFLLSSFLYKKGRRRGGTRTT